ncbi:MAG: antibiotic biosynthesis monooxygenase [Candidatus Entotheonellia bacterium]
MARLTRRAVMQAGGVFVGGMAFDMAAFIRQAGAQTGTPAQAVYISMMRAMVAPGAASEIAKRVQKGFVPMMSREPGFLAYYLMSGPDNELTTISIFQQQAAADASNEKALQWIKQNIASLVHSSIQFTVGQALVHKTA